MATSKGPITGHGYGALKGKLFQSIPRAAAGKFFLVQTFYKTNEGYNRVYYAYTSSVDFYIYYYKLKEREYHEVILGERSQKPRFDIDLESNKVPNGFKLETFGHLVRDTLIESILEVLIDLGTPLKSLDQLIICSSHSKAKYSCHIIISGMMHYNNEEAREFFNLVTRKSEQIKENDKAHLSLESVIAMGILDNQIYKSIQCFRMIGSGKRDSNGNLVRTKNYQRYVEYKGVLITFPEIITAKDEMNLFRRASITDTTGCTYIPVIVPKKKEISNKIILPDGAEADIMPMVNFFDKDIFEVLDTNGSFIALKRLRPSYCVICNRTHDNTGPFVMVRDDGSVYFYCRRAPKGNNNRKIGNIDGVTNRQSDSPTFSDSEESPPGSPVGTPVNINPYAELIAHTGSLDYIHQSVGLAKDYVVERCNRDTLYKVNASSKERKVHKQKMGNEHYSLSFNSFNGGSKVQGNTHGFSNFSSAFSK
jgi:hypothetical protein